MPYYNLKMPGEVDRKATSAQFAVQDSEMWGGIWYFSNVEGAAAFALSSSAETSLRYDVMDNRTPGKDTLHMYRRGAEVFNA